MKRILVVTVLILVGVFARHAQETAQLNATGQELAPVAVKTMEL